MPNSLPKLNSKLQCYAAIQDQLLTETQISPSRRQHSHYPCCPLESSNKTVKWQRRIHFIFPRSWQDRENRTQLVVGRRFAPASSTQFLRFERRCTGRPAETVELNFFQSLNFFVGSTCGCSCMMSSTVCGAIYSPQT